MDIIRKSVESRGGYMYFDDHIHFENFICGNTTTFYGFCRNQDGMRRTNLLFYLAYEKYDLLEKAINYGLLTNISCRKKYYVGKEGIMLNILTFACFFSESLSSKDIVRYLLNYKNINLYDKSFSDSILIHMITHSQKYYVENSYEIIKLIVEDSPINVDHLDSGGDTALLNTLFLHKKLDKKFMVKTVKLLLKHCKILNRKNGYHGLIYICEEIKDKELQYDLLKLFLEHENLDLSSCFFDKTLQIFLLSINNTIEKQYELWKLSSKRKNINSMFSLGKDMTKCRHILYLSGNLPDKFRKYIIFQRFNIINYRKNYRKNVLLRYY
jgi:hypothetical protein